MTLIQVLELISDSAEVRVYNTNDDEIARYNGKDSIPEKLNEEPVDCIRALCDYCKGNGLPYIAIHLM